MKTTFVLAVTVMLFALSSSAAIGASSSQNAMKDCNASWKAMDAASKEATTHKAFMSSCLSKGGSSATNTIGGAMTGAAGAVGGAASSAMTGAGNAVGSATHAVGGAASNAMTGAGNAIGGAASSGMAMGSSMMGSSRTATTSHSKIPVEGNTGTSARCKDGTTISIHTHSGACSHHGGVAAWL